MAPPASDLLFPLLILLSLLPVILGQCANKEPVFYEDSYATIDYALLGNNKQISLCRVIDSFEGCDIKWYKNGARMMPTSNVAFGDNSQYVFINKVGPSDAGNYSCSVSSSGGEISRSLTMRLYEDTSYAPLSNSWSECKLDSTSLGGDVSAVCKFDVGVRPDEAGCTWWKQNASAVPGSWEEWLPVYSFTEIQSEDRKCEDPREDELRCGNPPYPPNTNHIFTYLTLYNVTEEYYGNYAITVSNGDVTRIDLELNPFIEEPVITTIKSTIIYIVVSIIVGAFLVLFPVWQIVKTDVKLYIKDNFGNKTENDWKLYDAYISYIDTDTQFALSLKKHLELRGYKVFLPAVDITPGGCTVEGISRALEQSRRFIMILSERYISGKFTALEVTSFVDQASQYRKNIISIVFKGSSFDADNCRTILKHVLSVSRVVKWNNIIPAESDTNGEPVIDGKDSTAVVVPTESAIQPAEKSFKAKVFKELLLGMPRKPKMHSTSEGNVEVITMQSHIGNGVSNNICHDDAKTEQTDTQGNKIGGSGEVITMWGHISDDVSNNIRHNDAKTKQTDTQGHKIDK